MIFVLLTGIISYSCGSVPVKPEVESCLLIRKENIAFCVNNMTLKEREIPIIIDGELNPELDKHTSHNNEHWGKILVYIRLLEYSLPRNSKIKQDHNLYKVYDILKEKK